VAHVEAQNRQGIVGIPDPQKIPFGQGFMMAQSSGLLFIYVGGEPAVAIEPFLHFIRIVIPSMKAYRTGLLL
jgi:hypothetical protein